MAGKVGGKVIGTADLVAQLKGVNRMFAAPELSQLCLVGAEVIAGEVKDSILDAGLFDQGTLWASVEAYGINQYSAGVKVGAVYAAVHEFGLPNQRATSKQIRFFWAMYMNTGDGMWKALALKGSYTIPARPYFRPGVDKGKSKAVDAMVADANRRLATGAGSP